jgi:hypothetical protein
MTNQMSRIELSRAMADHIAPALFDRGFYEISDIDHNEVSLGQGRSFFYRASQTRIVRANIWVTDLEEPSFVADCTTHTIPVTASNRDAAEYANDDFATENIAIDRVIDVRLIPNRENIPIGFWLFAMAFQMLYLFWVFIAAIVSGLRNKSDARPSKLAHRFMSNLPKLDRYVQRAP